MNPKASASASSGSSQASRRPRRKPYCCTDPPDLYGQTPATPPEAPPCPAASCPTPKSIQTLGGSPRNSISRKRSLSNVPAAAAGTQQPVLVEVNPEDRLVKPRPKRKRGKPCAKSPLRYLIPLILLMGIVGAIGYKLQNK